MFIAVDTCGRLRVRILIVEPITIRRLKCSVVRGGDINSRDAELSTRRSVAEITVYVTQKWFDRLRICTRVDPFIMSAIPNNWL